VRWRPPAGVRVEAALADGVSVPPHYDSMLAKIVAQAPTREAALARLAAALDETVCWGVTTNRAFLARVVRDPDVVAGAVDTAFVARRWSDDAARASPASSWLEAIAAASLALLPRAPLPALWRGWSSSPAIDTTATIDVDGKASGWQLVGTRAAFEARSAQTSHRIEALASDGRFIDAVVDGRQRRVDFVVDDDGHGHWQCEGAELAGDDLRMRGATRERSEPSGVLVAPMHGRVTQACVAEGSEVAAGALLVVIEAMKMEHQIRAPHAGRVASLHVRAGDQVAARQPLVEVAA
ncbi:MAG: 3-methylcrotonyl-CoA carboxylase, partial [Rhizobacter sp.]|nr:3-methylcrotonyl-CoA carboxylase [Rhizobacter sp.]